ncbi:hypothetical protein K435DRAFT_843817 [Dendrothele bispora CBS 962.96]|uniref:Uncharacterized protein n=1 Tax=Dendrothele bispora (strain CBS 962.96) TaxID=1314807 RepID=A0A4V4HCP0_DENBC|nr:hypothetical protein K435DRAFT_843817 [Dendrothele bispora CBS 962.96]
MKWIERELRKLQEAQEKKRKETERRRAVEEEAKRKEERKRKEQESERVERRGVQPTKRMRVQVLIPMPERRLGVAAKSKGPSTQAITTLDSDNYSGTAGNDDDDSASESDNNNNPDSEGMRAMSPRSGTECLELQPTIRRGGRTSCVACRKAKKGCSFGTTISNRNRGGQKGKARNKTAVEPSDVEEEEFEEGQEEREEEEEREVGPGRRGRKAFGSSSGVLRQEIKEMRAELAEARAETQSLAGAPEAATTTREETTLLASAVENIGRRLRKIEESHQSRRRGQRRFTGSSDAAQGATSSRPRVGHDFFGPKILADSE